MLKFSVIVPVYNAAPYLGTCLDSLSRQTCRDWEAICVDDGSTDGSGTILDEYAMKDARFRVVHQKNAGVSAARNAALGLATGEWVCFLDADDLFQPWILQHVVDALGHEPLADVVVFKTMFFDEKGSVPHSTTSSGAIVQIIDSRREVDIRNAGGFFCEKAYRRSLIGDVRFMPYRVGEDLLYELEVMVRSNKTLELDSIGYCYRQRVGSAMHSGVTAQKVRDMMYRRLDTLNCVAKSQKHVGTAYVKRILNGLFEKVPFVMMELSGDEMREVFGEWRIVLAEAEKTGCVRGFQKVRYWAFKLLPSCAMAKALFVFPHWLKSKGVHG